MVSCAYPISGGGAIAPHVDAFFEAVGIELLVGYGLTETSPVVSCRRPWRNIRGSSGLPMPETEFRIVDPESARSGVPSAGPGSGARSAGDGWVSGQAGGHRQGARC